MQTTGILSILPSIEASSQPTFDLLYQLVGQNTGNLLFTNAVWNQIAGPKERINFTFDPGVLNKSLTHLVIPAANWLSPLVDFTELADQVEQLAIPVVLIGLGAQDSTFSGSIDIPEGTVRFVKAVAERSASISVRGEYSAQMLASLGIHNVVVTGCPSLYHDFQSFEPPPQGVRIRVERGLIHSTRYSMSYAPFAATPSAHRALFRFAYAEGLDLLFQSEKEEIALLTGHGAEVEMEPYMRPLFKRSYGAAGWDSLMAYWTEHGRVFFDVGEWAKAMNAYDYVLGSRLHGTIMALNSGVPAILVHHDSRTRELAEFAAIPSVAADQLRLRRKDVESMFARADLDAYYTKRAVNRQIYRSFLETNGIPAAQF